MNNNKLNKFKIKNKINNARATLVALSNLRFITVTAKNRGLSLEKLTGRKSYEEVKEIKPQSKSTNETKSSRKPKDGEGRINKNKGQ